MPTIVHHKARLDDSEHPPNTLEAVRESLKADAEWIEVDIRSLKDGADYLLIHDEMLDTETTGDGPVEALTVGDALRLRLQDAPHYSPALLSDVIALFEGHVGRTRLQLDFKHIFPFTSDDPLKRLAEIIEPIADRVHVSSPADWNLRRLGKIAPWLDLGFDIVLYLINREPGKDYDTRHPPFREGSYGYHDDSLLSLVKVWPNAEYLADRCNTLLRQVPNISTLYVDHRTLTKSLDDGFNWATACHHANVRLSTWTIDVGDEQAVENARRLRAAGVDQFTSNTPQALRHNLIT